MHNKSSIATSPSGGLVANFSFVVPARNEARILSNTLRGIDSLELGVPLIVVDNGSTDGTEDVARACGARVVHCSQIGKGHAVRAGVLATGTEWVFLCDADINGLAREPLLALVSATEPDRVLGRLSMNRTAIVTNLVARPLLGALGLPTVSEPLGGLAFVKRDFLLGLHLPGDWGFDVALTLAALRAVGDIPEVPCTDASHRGKELDEYVPMAEQVVAAILSSTNLMSWDHHNCIMGPACSLHRSLLNCRGLAGRL
jgi:hypothetical protein